MLSKSAVDEIEQPAAERQPQSRFDVEKQQRSVGRQRHKFGDELLARRNIEIGAGFVEDQDSWIER